MTRPNSDMGGEVGPRRRRGQDARRSAARPLARTSHGQMNRLERAEQNSPGREPWERMAMNKSPEKAKRPASPFQGSTQSRMGTQGLRPGLSCSAPSGL